MWIGREGLAAALAASDEVPGGSAALLDRARARFGPELTWPARVMGTPDATAVLASFAPDVDAAAAACPVAADVMDRAAHHLVDAVETGLRYLPGVRAVATGGALRLRTLDAALTRAAHARGVPLERGLGGSLEGALHLAAHVAAGRPLATARPYLVV